MVNPKQVAACAMAFTMAMSAVFASGCAKKPKGSNEVISADSVWYNMEKHELILDYDPADYDYIYSKTLGKVGDYAGLEVNMRPPGGISSCMTITLPYLSMISSWEWT